MTAVNHRPNTNPTMIRTQGGTAKTLRRVALLAVAVLAFAIASRAPAADRVFGLVVGIDDYPGTVNDLGGAVNDAEDIAAALHEAGAGEVVLLRDGAASKAAISAAWNRLVDEAEAGDTIVFSYAGHGSQEPEPPGRHGEQDGRNETFILGGYSAAGPGSRERIVDDEVFDWLTRADDKRIEVIFVADSCHSGTMYRSAGPVPLRYRTGQFEAPDPAGDLLQLPYPRSASTTESDFHSVTFIAATQDDRLTPEVMIDGKPRGALSWAFARAVRGAADRNGDGQLTQQELLGYLVPTVEAEAENQQVPDVLPLRSGGKPVMRIASTGVGPSVTEKQAEVRLYVRGVGSVAVPDVAGVAVTTNPGDADLIWNPKAGTIDHRIGGRVADHVTPAGITPVLSKWSALAFIKAHVGDDPIMLSLPTGNRTYGRGEIVGLAMDGARVPYLTLFNLPPDGRVEYFYPATPEDVGTSWVGRPLRQRFRVDDPPFGAEHLVAILTETPALALHQALRSMGTAEQAGGLAATLRETLAGMPFQAGVVGIYTTDD